MKKKLLALLLLNTIVLSLFAQKALIYQIDIDSEINSTSWRFLNKGLDEAEKLNADAVLIHLNTYGGAVVDADSMRTAILYYPKPVYVFIDNNAASAGALISIACTKIFMRPGGVIGAATAVDGGTGEKAPEKTQAYMRGMMRTTAEKRGRDPLIAEAMVDERIVIPGLSEAGWLLSMTPSEAMKVGYCDGIADSIDEVITGQLGYKNYEITSYQPTFMDKLMGFLTNPAFRAILIMIIVAGIYFELQSPGIGFPSLAAIVAAILYFTPLYLEGLVQHWELAAFIVGILLILVEIFVLPGFGVAGISGIILLGMGLIFSMLDNYWFNFENVHIPDLSTSLLVVLSGFLLSFLVIIFLSTQIGRKGMFRKIALDADLSASESADLSEDDLVGQTGTAMTDLRPSGKVIVNNEVYDAVSNLGYIESGQSVKVIKYENMQLYVEKS